MSRIRSRNTGPERAVGRLLRSLGFRPQTHRRDLPGIPDLVLPRYKIALFVHGCFWHRHARCRYAYAPKSNRAFWTAKFEGNVRRDREVNRQLVRLGWRALVIWECEVQAVETLKGKLRKALRRGHPMPRSAGDSTKSRSRALTLREGA
jgi:DNA mismatch endonuclease (patch repair protein)